MNALYAETVEHLQSNPYIVRSEYHLEPVRCVFTIEKVDPGKPLIGVLLGDFAHNARSCLDQFVWQLVSRKKKPGKWNQFPIYSDRDNFFCEVELPAKRKGRGPLGGLTPGSPEWALIEGAQPYNRAQSGKTTGVSLNAIAALNNEDKHRVVPRLLSAIKRPSQQEWVEKFVPVRDVASVDHVDVHWGPELKPGTRFATVHFTPSGPNPEVNMEGNLPIDVAFGEVAFRAVNLPGLLGDIWRFINASKPFFPPERWPFDLSEVPPETVG